MNGVLFYKLLEKIKMLDSKNSIDIADTDDSDLVLRLQKERLKKRGLNVNIDIEAFNEMGNGILDRMFNDNDSKYEDIAHMCKIKNKTKYSFNKKVLYKKNRYEILCAFVSHVKDEKNILEDIYCCPSCGNVEEVGELLKGCRYCRNKFILTDLFPVINSYYVVPNYIEKTTKRAVNAQPLMKKFLKFLIFIDVIVLIGVLLSNPVLVIVYAFYLAAITGFVMLISVMLYNISLFVGLLISGIKSIPDSIKIMPMLSKSIRTTKKFKAFLKENNLDVSITYLAGKALTLIKTLIYTDNRENLAISDIKKIDPSFDKIIDISYRGRVSFKNYYIKDNNLYIELILHTRNLYYDRKIREKDDDIVVTLYKSLNVIDVSSNSIHLIKCHTCGSSFNALHLDKCPNCRNDFKLHEYDWVINNISK